MDVGQLKAFLVVADELHFARAAKRLHIAQPPLSRIIKRLETEMGTRLLDRTTRSVELTASGQALIAPAAEVLEALRRAEEAVMSAENGESGLVRIGFAGVSTHQMVARLARRVKSSRPGIQLELSSQTFALSAMKKLMQKETDIVLGRWDAIPAEISSRVVMQDSLVLAMPDTHRLACATRLTLGQLADEGFVSLFPYEGAVLPDRLHRLAQEAGFLADVVQLAPDTQTALALVSAEVGCHVTLSSVAKHWAYPHVVFVPLEHSTSDVPLLAAWRRDDPSKVLQDVLDEVICLDEAT